MTNTTETQEFKQLKSNEIQSTRDHILKEQNGVCALCNEVITQDSGASLDHQHKRKSDPIGVDGAGLIRGVLCRACNVWEGKAWNSTTRYMQPKSVQERIDMLKNLIMYYEKENYPLVHPNEKVPAKIVSKANYNRLKKLYNEKKKLPAYPKSGKLTIGLQALFEKYEIQPYN